MGLNKKYKYLLKYAKRTRGVKYVKQGNYKRFLEGSEKVKSDEELYLEKLLEIKSKINTTE